MTGEYFTDTFFSRLETLSLHLRSDLTGFFGGKHLIRKYGQTVEFADFREYELGGDIRRIDWNLYARLGKFFLKLFTDERQMHIQLFLDCSASMGAFPKKGEYMLGLASALGFLAVHNTDKVSFHLLKDGGVTDPFGIIVGKNSFFRAIGELEKTTFGGEADFAECIPKTPSTGTHDGLSVIISDFFTENNWKRAVDFLHFKRRQVLLLQVLDHGEVAPEYSGRLDLVDAEAYGAEDPRNLRIHITRAMLNDYDDVLREWQAEIKRFCVSREADFVSADTSTPIEKTIFRDLLHCDLIR